MSGGGRQGGHQGVRHHCSVSCGVTLRADGGPAAEISTPIRPAISGSRDDELPEWVSRLGVRPVAYVSLGTVPIVNQPAAYEPLVSGLATLDADIIVTVGRQTDPAALGPQPPNIHIAQWLSLAACLPRCDAVLCHGGAGTTLTALSHGLPLMLSPRGADQFPTADAVRRAGRGPGAHLRTGDSRRHSAGSFACCSPTARIVMRPNAFAPRLPVCRPRPRRSTC
ncbi:glycosyltransferase [Nocardia acidivorans]|uniref:glycosyltransferase n=1 Tax=Nocardia acidivorans TaxID=404580 RepID=UPI0008360023|nr:nucleotide disphospho-sugar-binding domain-containing protein [Nocardia acidivorans]